MLCLGGREYKHAETPVDGAKYNSHNCIPRMGGADDQTRIPLQRSSPEVLLLGEQEMQ